MDKKTLDREASIQRLRSADFTLPSAEAIVDVVTFNREEISTNTDFVALSDAIEVVQTDVTELKIDVAALKTDVAALKKDVSALKTDVAVLKTDVSVLKTDVAKLKDATSEQNGEIRVLMSEFNSLEKKIDLHFDSMQVEFTALRKDFDIQRTNVTLWMSGGVLFTIAFIILGISALVKALT